MASEQSLGQAFSQSVRTFPADLTAVVGLTGLTVLAVTLPGVRETPLRTVLAVPYLLFLPGYTLISALFPEKEGASEGALTVRPWAGHGIGPVERLVFSIGFSICLVPAIALVLGVTSAGVRLGPVVFALSVGTVVCALYAALRRQRLPQKARFRVPYNAWLGRGRDALLSHESRADAALSVLLGLSILLAGASAVYVAAVPAQDDPFTEFYLHTADGDEQLPGDATIDATRTDELAVGISNHEHERSEYTVVVRLEQVEYADSAAGGDSSLVDGTIQESRELQRFQTTLDHNETWRETHEVSAGLAGENVRVRYLLYRGEAPESPSSDAAYRDLYVWIDDSSADGGQASG